MIHKGHVLCPITCDRVTAYLENAVLAGRVNDATSFESAEWRRFLCHIKNCAKCFTASSNAFLLVAEQLGLSYAEKVKRDIGWITREA